MSLIALLLLLVSAFIHAGWNYIGKKKYPSIAFFFLANLIGMTFVLPVLIIFWSRVPFILQSVWVFPVMSGFFLAGYLAALSGDYRAGDMSIAYPLARSLFVIFITLISIIRGKGYEFEWRFVAGIVLVIAGCLLLPIKKFHNLSTRNYLNKCCLLAAVASLGISGYTILDHEALGLLRKNPGRHFGIIDGTLIYLALEAVSTSFWKGLFVIFSLRQRRKFIEVIKAYKGAAAITGIAMYLNYGIVLVSMNFVRDVSYVAAFRQLSIPIGAVLGMVFLKEPGYTPKIVGVLVIFSGLFLVGTG